MKWQDTSKDDIIAFPSWGLDLMEAYVSLLFSLIQFYFLLGFETLENTTVLKSYRVLTIYSKLLIFFYLAQDFQTLHWSDGPHIWICWT